jgi:hypothetical protein
MRTRLAYAALAFLSGCVWGMPAERFPPAISPDGAHVAVRLRGEGADRVGELLAVDTVGLTIRGDHIVRMPWAKVEALDVADVGGYYDIRFGEPITAEKIARLALLARFPQGMRDLPITIDSLIAEAKQASARFADRRVAVEEGYRRLGADFPGMGEHWLKVQTLLQPKFDAAHPAILTYADVRGQPTLLGVGYALVTHGDSAPRGAPGWPERWHEHSGLLSEETAAGPTSRPSGPSTTHVFVMHVWTSLVNPDGQLAADNWALPFLRAGVPVPADVDAPAGHALSLAVGGDGFLRDALTDVGMRTSANAALVDSLIAVARTRVAGNLARGVDVEELRAAWASLSDGLESVIGGRVRDVVGASHNGMHAGMQP